MAGEPDPIAVVGMAFEFPQDATSESAFWQMLHDGRSAHTEFPRDRLNIGAYFHPDSDRPGTIPVRGGNFLASDLAAFDAPFFSITPAEASCMDPQHRKILETAYHALEDAGIPIGKCTGSDTSVYTGCFTNDYLSVLQQDYEAEQRHAAMGIAPSMLANRLSWFFNFKGTSMNLDSACSSSLLALHLACQELRAGSSSMALVCGANLVYHPNFMKMMSDFNFLSPDSQCWSFDQKANGYSRGEGFVVLVVKRLEHALRDGDTIRAVIRNTCSNQDGRTPGITQPSQDAQIELIRRTYDQGKIEMEPTRYFEAHGTGTPIGDPIEASAIGAAFRGHRTLEDPLYIGATKANIGHLEGASGLAGIVKAIMVLEKGIIPPIAQFSKLNEKIDAQSLPLHFPRAATAWPGSGLRRACVNSFGFGGTNATAIIDDAYHYLNLHGLNGHHRMRTLPKLEESPRIQPQSHSSDSGYEDEPAPKLLVCTASDEDVLRAMSQSHGEYISQNPKYLEDIAFVLSARRSEFNWRSFAVAQPGSIGGFKSIEFSGPSKVVPDPRCAFIFTGQGAQYQRMGLELGQHPGYVESLKTSQECLNALGCEWSAAQLLQDDAVDLEINQPAFSQPLTTILQIALCDLLESYNIRPTVVIGHSSGEIAAAYAAGALTRHAAVKVAYYRGLLSSILSKQSEGHLAMMAVGLSKSDVMPYLDRLLKDQGQQDISVGCVNSPSSVTLSGDFQQLQTVQIWLRDDKVFSKMLKVPVAYHSPYMVAIADEYERLLGVLDGPRNPSQVSMISSVTGDIIATSSLRKPRYWIDNLTSTVEFEAAVGKLVAQTTRRPRKKLGQSKQYDLRCSHLLEIGPHQALKGPIREIIQSAAVNQKPTYVSTLVRGQDAFGALLGALGTLYCSGHPVNLLSVNFIEDHTASIPPGMPKYPFSHTQTYWRESRLSRNMRFPEKARHDLLGMRSLDWNKHVSQWRNIIRLQQIPWLQDHQIGNDVIFPAAAMILMALEAFVQLSEDDRSIPLDRIQLNDITFSHPITFLLGKDYAETQLTLSRDSASTSADSWTQFRLFVVENDEYVECCRGQIRDCDIFEADQASPMNPNFLNGKTYHQWTKDVSTSVETNHEQDCYSLPTGSKVKYGPTFQNLERMHVDADGHATALLDTESWRSRETPWTVPDYLVHPTTIDGLAQLVVPTLYQKLGQLPTMVPSRISNIWLSLGQDTLRKGKIHVAIQCGLCGQRGASANIVASSPDLQTPVAVLEGLETTFIGGGGMMAAEEVKRTLCTKLVWRPDIQSMDSEQIFRHCTINRPKQPLHAVESYKMLTVAIMCFVEEAVVFADHNSSTNISKHLKSYVEWTRYQHQRLRDGKTSLEENQVLSLLSDSSARQQLINDVENSGIEGRFFMRLGTHLIDILRGDADALELMFGDGLADLYYEAMLANEHHSHPASAYVELACLSNPSMKILEVGAGTGGQTLRLLEKMSNGGVKKWQTYDYTDISPSFFGQAREKFRDYVDHMSFRVCDISKDPIAQSFEAGSYDMVVASHVLHATNSLQQSLRNIRKLLKPEGKLLLFETTVPETIPIGFAFGLLQGWWDPLENEARSPFSPCLITAGWDNRLRDAGFSGVDIDIPGQEELECRYSSIIVSTAVDDSVLTERHEPSRAVTIIIQSEIEVQIKLAGMLKDSIDQSVYTIDISTVEEAAAVPPSATSMVLSLLEVDSTFLDGISEANYTSLQKVLLQNKNVLWITRDLHHWSEPRHHLVDGLGRTLMSEDATRKFTTLCVEGYEEPLQDVPGVISKLIDKVFNLPVEKLENGYVLKQGLLHISRVVEQPDINEQVAKSLLPVQSANCRIGDSATLTLQLHEPADIESVEWRQGNTLDEDSELGEDQVIVDVKAIGLSMRDRLVVSGSLGDESVLSTTECSGVVTRAGSSSSLQPGNRVCVLYQATNQNRMRVPTASAVILPEQMSFAIGASLPTALWLAYHALIDLARLEEDETVLIYDGHSCVGQLAIQIAKKVGARVVTTTSSDAKQLFLQERLGLPKQSILRLKADRLPRGLYGATDGEKVDVIVGSFLPSMSSDLTMCLKSFGRLINISPSHERAVNALDFNTRSLSLFSVDLMDALRTHPTKVFKVFQRAFKFAAEWDIKPLGDIHLFDAQNPKDALSSLIDTDILGKRIIELEENSSIPARVPTKSKCVLRPDATYIIGGGLGGLGRSFARWMVSRGARNLVLLSRSGPTSPAAHTLVTELTARNITVVTPAVDISNLQSLTTVLAHVSRTLPPIRGCIQATVALHDALFPNMTHSDWTLSTASKVQSSANLHAVLPQDLDFFVLLSSLNGLFGGRAQANYAAGNTFKDALAHQRIAQGQKAVSIDLGLMVSEGVVAENEFLLQSMRRIGHLMEIEVGELEALLDIYCDVETPTLSHEEVQVLVGIELPALVVQKGIDLHHSIRRPIFRHLFCMATDPTGTSDMVPKGTLKSRETALKEVKTSAEATALVVEWFSAKIAQVLGLKEDDIDKTKPINAYGIDSLVAIDLKNWMQREVGSEMEIFVLLANVSLEDMCKEAVSKSNFLGKEVAKENPSEE